MYDKGKYNLAETYNRPQKPFFYDKKVFLLQCQKTLTGFDVETCLQLVASIRMRLGIPYP
jgi:hypothetical protein